MNRERRKRRFAVYTVYPALCTWRGVEGGKMNRERRKRRFAVYTVYPALCTCIYIQNFMSLHDPCLGYAGVSTPSLPFALLPSSVVL